VLEEGVTADPDNVDVYLALDGVLSAANAGPDARVSALRRYPSADRMPASMIFKLALALAEAGDAAGAEALFHDRFFPQEEGGTNVRAVYAQVRLTSARVAAGTGDCTAARRIVDALPREQQGLPFTSGGLADTLQPATMTRQLAAVDWSCGRKDAARAAWDRLAKGFGGDSPLAVAIADEARVRLGVARSAIDRRHLQAVLESATRTLESGGTSNPGTLEYARARLLAALGRTDESRESLRRVFLFPDRNLSHAVARDGRGVPDPRGARGE
jgi:hypothetical protein